MGTRHDWHFTELLERKPLEMILEGLGSISSTPLIVKDRMGGVKAFRPGSPSSSEPAEGREPVFSPIELEGSTVGMVIGYSAGQDSERVSMTVALAASLIAQFLQAHGEVEDLSSAVTERRRDLEVLTSMGERLQLGVDEDEVARTVLREAVRLSGAERGLLLLDRQGTHFRTAAREGYPDGAAVPDAVPWGTGVTGWVATSGMPVVLSSIGRLPEGVSFHAPSGCRAEPFLEFPAVALPLRFGSRTLGVLWILGRRGAIHFDREHIALLRGLAGQCGIFLWSGRTVESLRAEERRRLEEELALRLRDRFLLHPRATDPTLQAASCGTGRFDGPAHGTLVFRDRREGFFLVAPQGGGLDASAAAAVLRCLLVQEATHHTTPFGLLRALDGILRTLAGAGSALPILLAGFHHPASHAVEWALRGTEARLIAFSGGQSQPVRLEGDPREVRSGILTLRLGDALLVAPDASGPDEVLEAAFLETLARAARGARALPPAEAFASIRGSLEESGATPSRLLPFFYLRPTSAGPVR